ncbi:NAD-dependent epimerase/dehydratase family protein [Bacteroides sp.]|uniref:NAD-dependent epimerase/dehydratase family protein n=1 Tax=Bacteroides sp. TaxID=29523 RepID=UPI003A9206C2
MKVLLTGITGFVGQNLIPMLLKECPNDEFLTMNLDAKEAERKYPSALYGNFSHVGINDFKSVEEFNPDVTIHLATVTTARNDTEIIVPMMKANIEFGVLLLDALSRCSAMKLFVNTGSFAEFRYGNGDFDAAYLYTASKTAFRSFVDYYSTLCGFKYMTAIPYSVYGGKMTVKRLMDYIKESMDSENPVDMTPGEQILDFIHVNDVASFFTHVLKNMDRVLSAPNGTDFHLGTGRGTSIRELAEMIEVKYGKKCNINFGGRPYRERDIMYAVAPIAKNMPLIGWKANIDISEGC